MVAGRAGAAGASALPSQREVVDGHHSARGDAVGDGGRVDRGMRDRLSRPGRAAIAAARQIAELGQSGEQAPRVVTVRLSESPAAQVSTACPPYITRARSRRQAQTRQQNSQYDWLTLKPIHAE